ncbi:hypothetical protein [Bacteriovorax sp. Seq25_V]|uniref:hypothetical protein n=1 Tax=Bacteriovorax sp. Seq25_V TaxID=1201288 RepID=UPI00038A0BEB|nr:hypothetical protein [Bacteriovorax sp. Seq25_V]EQC43833.1 putative lipoprotein [Bacteriovorax sp. Seq25_V]
MKNLITIFTLLVLTSCAGIKTIETVEKQQYRPRTQKELLLEKYRLMRARNWDKLQEDEKSHKSYKKITIVPKHTAEPKKPKVVRVDEKEQEIEISQNLTYFCMDRRKESRFSEDGSCAIFTENIYSDCLDQFEIGDARLTRCVKSRLR